MGAPTIDIPGAWALPGAKEVAKVKGKLFLDLGTLLDYVGEMRADKDVAERNKAVIELAERLSLCLNELEHGTGRNIAYIVNFDGNEIAEITAVRAIAQPRTEPPSTRIHLLKLHPAHETILRVCNQPW